MLRFVHGAALLLVILAAHPCGAARVEADRGAVIPPSVRPQRIIALSPHLAEIAFAAGAGPQIVAAVRFSDYPAAAARLPQVGDASRIDVERVIALRPDLILAWRSGNPAGDLQRLAALGFRLFVSEPRRLSDIGHILREVGALAGTDSVAERAAVAFEHDLEALRTRYGTRAPVRVFYEIWHRPLLTVNRAHLISDVITLCGGVNVFAGAAVLTPSVTLEAVLAARPQVILGGSSAMRPGELESEWRRSPVSALRQVPVRYVPADLIQRQTPRIAQGAQAVCSYLDEVRAPRQ